LPKPIEVYDETIRVLKSAVENAKLGYTEQVQALKRLDDQARRLEDTANGPSLESFIAANVRPRRHSTAALYSVGKWMRGEAARSMRADLRQMREKPVVRVGRCRARVRKRDRLLQGYAGVPQVAASACMLARVMPPVAIRSIARTMRAGSRWWIMWPAPFSTSSRLPGIAP